MKKALIVVDMQNDFITGSLGSEHAQSIVENVCRKIAGFDGDVFFTRDTHEQASYMSTTEGKGLPVMHCVQGTHGWQIEDRVWAALLAHCASADALDEQGFNKVCFGAPLLAERIAKEYAHVELVGLCTDVCVISNAVLLRSQHPHMQVTVDASCCAGVTLESHQAALTAMNNCGIQVVGE